jgi:hypothetical protein
MIAPDAPAGPYWRNVLRPARPVTVGPPPAVARLPCEPGVYRFRDARGQVLYVGRASTLRSRVASYWSDLRDRRHLAPMAARVEAVACGSARRCPGSAASGPSATPAS